MNDDEIYIKQEHISDNGLTELDMMQDGSPSTKDHNLLSHPLAYTASNPGLRQAHLDNLGMPKYNTYQYDDYRMTRDALPTDAYGNFTNLYISEGQIMVPTVSDPGFYELRPAGSCINEHPMNQLLDHSNLGRVEPIMEMSSSPRGSIKPQVKTEETDSLDVHSAEEHGISDTNFQSKQDKKPRAKSAHNLIEQRYRNKMNEKFQVLRDSVPVLREYKRASNSTKDEDYGNEDMGQMGDEQVEGELAMAPVKKLNKGIILTKSIEYIKYLESKNQRKMMEYQQLLERAEMLGYKVSRD